VPGPVNSSSRATEYHSTASPSTPERLRDHKSRLGAIEPPGSPPDGVMQGGDVGSKDEPASSSVETAVGSEFKASSGPYILSLSR
jgi:hypothetical protein